MSTSGLHIEQFLWFMKGASCPVLTAANDGQHYIVKLAHDAEGAIAFNESAGSELFSACGLSTAPWVPLTLTQEVIDEAIKRRPEMSGCFAEMKPGLYCGSQYLGAPGTRLFQALPADDLARVRNRVSFWLAWLVDVCAEQTCRRQAVFVKDHTQSIDAFFVDHGGLFRGPRRNAHPDFAASRHSDEHIYIYLRPSEMAGIPRILNSLNTDKLYQKINSLPEVWRSSTSLSAFEDCLDRIANHALLEEIMHGLDHIHRTNPRILLGTESPFAHLPLSQFS